MAMTRSITTVGTGDRTKENTLPFPGVPMESLSKMDRTRFDQLLAGKLKRATKESRALSLLLVNPDNFASVTERLGWDLGDQVLHEIEVRVRSAVRRCDPLTRYGGASYAILLESAPSAAVGKAEKIRRIAAAEAYLSGRVHLHFSVGVATFDPGSEEPSEASDLLWKATQSLNAAKRMGGGRCIDWHGRLARDEPGAVTKVPEIFTGDIRRDYRNMTLIWYIVSSIAGSQSTEELAPQVVDQLWTAFLPDRLGLFEQGKESEPRLIRGVTRVVGSEIQARVETLEPTSIELDLVALAINEKEIQQALCLEPDGRLDSVVGTVRSDVRSRLYAIPLTAGSDCLGALLLVGREPALALEASDTALLEGLCSHLAHTLERFRLAEFERRERRDHSRQMEEELRQLRQVLGKVKLVHRSREMEELLERSRRVATTDATVLITGESGTGKEVLARTVHELSPRRDQPFVVVDCSAIATSLIERELFGNEKGAYTGAERSRPGLIAQAEGGSVMLDEIGELPLEVQSKLLRLVQEKELTPVGATRPLKVNARIIACTNRDLHTEVRAGRFREDLYHRMNVVRLQVPPLRERRGDVLPLTRYFLESFAIQFQRPVLKLTPEAERSLLEYAWPGNVRELQNRLMQAVIFSQTGQIDSPELGLEDHRAAAAEEPPSRTGLATAEDRARPLASEATDGPATERAADLWKSLREALRRQVTAVDHGKISPGTPLGRWLVDDVVRAAAEACGEEIRRVAPMLGVSPATCRRWMKRAAARRGPRSNTAIWNEVRDVLAQLVRQPSAEVRDLAIQAENMLLAEIVARFPGRTRIGAELLGVSPPTFRRRVRRIGAIDC